VYQQHGRHINRRQAYRQQVGISTTWWVYRQHGGHIDNMVGVLTGDRHIDRRRAYVSTRGRCINRGQVHRQQVGVSGVSTGYVSIIEHFLSFFVLYLVFCSYKFMYLSSLLMNQSPLCFYKRRFLLAYT